MFFERLLNKIPFFRNRRIKKIKKDLAEIKMDFDDGFFNDKYINSLHNILNSSLIEFSEDLIEGTLNDIRTYTKSSLSAVKLIEKGVVKKSTLERDPTISMVETSRYFSDWYSNEDSVMEFVSLMREYVHVQVQQQAIPDGGLAAVLHVEKLTDSLNPDILDSLLYRLLLLDLVSVITFYLERKYDR